MKLINFAVLFVSTVEQKRIFLVRELYYIVEIECLGK